MPIFEARNQWDARSAPRELSDDEFRVALVLPSTGPAGIFGLECLAAAELAAAEIDRAGGVAGRRISFVDVEGGGDPADVARSVAALVSSGTVHAVTGWHLSNVRQEIARVLDGRVPYVYAAAYEGGERCEGVLCPGEVPGEQIVASLDWLRTELRLRRWYVIGNDYVWPRGSALRTRLGLQASDIRLVRERFVPLGTMDESVWASVIQDIVCSGADGVLTLLVGSDAVRFNRAFAAAGLARALVRFSPFVDETVILASGPEASENMFVAAGWFASMANASATEFARDFACAWDLVCGSDGVGQSHAPAPGTMAETTYSGVHLLARLSGTGLPTVQDVHRARSSIGWDSPHGTVELRDGTACHPVHLAYTDGTALEVAARVSTGRH